MKMEYHPELLKTTSTIKEQLDDGVPYVGYTARKGTWALSKNKNFWASVRTLQKSCRAAYTRAWIAEQVASAKSQAYVVITIEWSDVKAKLYWNWSDCKKYIQSLMLDFDESEPTLDEVVFVGTGTTIKVCRILT